MSVSRSKWPARALNVALVLVALVGLAGGVAAALTKVTRKSREIAAVDRARTRRESLEAFRSAEFAAIRSELAVGVVSSTSLARFGFPGLEDMIVYQLPAQNGHAPALWTRE